MDNCEKLNKHFDEHIETIKKLVALEARNIIKISSLLSTVLQNEGGIYWCGNGGSAADCQHLAAELVGRFKNNRRPLKSISLTTDSSVLTCIANDFGYDQIFARQIEGVGRVGDILVCVSTSGESTNIISALNAAKKMNITTIALLGKSGGAAKNLADHSIVVPSHSTARIQEAHILLGHIFCDLIEKDLGFA